MNPEYEALGELAKQIVIRTMQEGEKTHPDGDWRDKTAAHHAGHAYAHIDTYMDSKVFGGEREWVK